MGGFSTTYLDPSRDHGFFFVLNMGWVSPIESLPFNGNPAIFQWTIELWEKPLTQLGWFSYSYRSSPDLFSIFHLGAKNHGLGLGEGMVRLAWVDIPAKVDIGTSPGWAVGVDGLTVGRTSHTFGSSGFLVLRREKGREHLAPWVLLLKPGFLLHKSEIFFLGAWVVVECMAGKCFRYPCKNENLEIQVPYF